MRAVQRLFLVAATPTVLKGESEGGGGRMLFSRRQALYLGFVIMDSSIWVAVTTGFPAMLARRIMYF